MPLHESIRAVKEKRSATWLCERRFRPNAPRRLAAACLSRTIPTACTSACKLCTPAHEMGQCHTLNRPPLSLFLPLLRALSARASLSVGDRLARTCDLGRCRGILTVHCIPSHIHCIPSHIRTRRSGTSTWRHAWPHLRQVLEHFCPGMQLWKDSRCRLGINLLGQLATHPPTHARPVVIGPHALCALPAQLMCGFTDALQLSYQLFLVSAADGESLMGMLMGGSTAACAVHVLTIPHAK